MPIDKGRVPDAGAVVVQRLKAEGAVIMGKTATTELAYLVPSAPGAAPKGLGSAGDPIFNGLWTFTGMPAMTIRADRSAWKRKV